MWAFLIAVLIALGIAAAPVSSSDVPPPRQATGESQQPQGTPQTEQQITQDSQRGSDNLPLVVKVLPAAKNKKETAQAEADRQDVSSANWWMVRLTGVIGFIGLMQLFVFGRQATRLRQTVEKMDEVAAGQTADMRASIAEATRAATAMEQVSVSADKNTKTVGDMAKSQRDFWQLQMRAYVTVIIGTAVYQEREKPLLFEAKPLLVNTGQTPAHNVSHRIKADILPVPIANDMLFDLPYQPVVIGTVVGPHQERLLSAMVDKLYDDLEVPEIKTGKGRALCVWGTVNYRDVFGTAHYTNFCQMLTWLPDGRIMGYYHHAHNDSD